ncbi:MAG TPA: PsbP-related protein [Saprospiraceae bacterium]|nr:PsbP-related protein [Saprospiraceae bacterium]
MKLTAFLCFISIANYCFSQQDKSNEMINFVNNEFKLQYPESWTLDTSGQWGAAVMIFSPLESEADQFNENVNVLIQDLTGQNINLEKYKQITEEQITTLATDGKIIESAIVMIGNEESFRFMYTMTQGIFKLKISSVCLIHNDQAYLITFTGEVDQFDDYKSIGEQILNSFALIK